jgi:hypothetical protein
MVFPASEWGSRRFEDLFPPRKYQLPDGNTVEQPAAWQLLPSRMVEMKKIGDIEVREARRTTVWKPYGFSAEERAKEALQEIRQAGRYWGSDGGAQPQGTA